jgi:hypothetical protein
MHTTFALAKIYPGKPVQVQPGQQLQTAGTAEVADRHERKQFNGNQPNS